MRSRSSTFQDGGAVQAAGSSRHRSDDPYRRRLAGLSCGRSGVWLLCRHDGSRVRRDFGLGCVRGHWRRRRNTSGRAPWTGRFSLVRPPAPQLPKQSGTPITLMMEPISCGITTATRRTCRSLSTTSSVCGLRKLGAAAPRPSLPTPPAGVENCVVDSSGASEASCALIRRRFPR